MFGQLSSAHAANKDFVQPESHLSMLADVVGQTSCQADNDVFVVTLTLKLRFTNIIRGPVILAREIERPGSVRVGKNAKDVQSGDFEYDPNVDYFPTTLHPAPQFSDSPDAKYFAILQPQQTYEVTVKTSLFAAEDTAKAGKGTGLLSRGSHVLQLGIDSWPYQWPDYDSPVSAKELSVRWKEYGHLARGWGVLRTCVLQYS